MTNIFQDMICRFLAVVNSSCNFCLYCFMSRDFRTELFKMVQKCRIRQTPVTVTDRTSAVYQSPTSPRVLLSLLPGQQPQSETAGWGWRENIWRHPSNIPNSKQELFFRAMLLGNVVMLLKKHFQQYYTLFHLVCSTASVFAIPIIGYSIM